MLQERISIPVLSFRHSSVLYYTTPLHHGRNLMQSSAFRENVERLKSRKRYKGEVTPGAVKRMRKAITLLIQSTPITYKWNPVIQRSVAHQLSFVTLTMPPSDKATDAKFCQKHLLEPILRHFRTKHNMKSYIWKLELQDNGSVHYHITTDFVIHHAELKSYWNKLLLKNGMLEGFKKEYGHVNPNSTDIHQVSNIKNMEAYLVKYITKSYQNETAVNGKVWDCSLNLKKSDYFKMQLDTLTHQLIRTLQKTKQVATTYFEKAISLEFFTTDYYTFFTESIRNQFFSHLNNIRTWRLESPKTTDKCSTTSITTVKSISMKPKPQHLKGWQHFLNLSPNLSAH